MRTSVKILAAISALAFTTPAMAEWWRAQSDHFVVYSEGKEQEALELATRMERVDMAMRAMQNMTKDEDPVPVTIFRFGDTDDIGRLAGSRGVAGFYIPSSNGAVAFIPARKPRARGLGTRSDGDQQLDPNIILAHEYGHHFMLQNFPANYPAWYVEAYAEVYGTVDIQPKGVFRLGLPATHRANQFLYDERFPAKKLFFPPSKLEPGDSRHFYSVGWLLAHYLTFTDKRPGQLTEYLKLVNDGKTSMQAAEAAFGDLEKLSEEVRKYQNTALGAIEFIPNNYQEPIISVRQLTPAEEAVIPYVIKSSRGVTKSTAPGVADRIRSAAAQYSDDKFVLDALIEAEFDAKNFAASDAAADRALAVDPKNSKALLYKGMIRMERGKTDSSEYVAARPYFVKAFESDDHNARSLILNYLSYYKAGEAIPESALLGLEQGYKLSPYDPYSRIVLARQFLNEKKGDLARYILGPLVQDPDEEKSEDRNKKDEDDFIGRCVNYIDAGDLTNASAELTRMLDKAEEDNG
ncbi:tetratricopeptide repeat protein [Sphingorhabdus arenilitoris]|uniref:Tetratricopeptide repeat protein n=1 Tax=Sphingorhabdus arenilitoris TaxID=1490041 RepID=A0ABV8RIL2_9SPHN